LELHEIIVRPESAFGTPLRGDTIFGHFCWQVAYDPGLVRNGLDEQISRYAETPFVVFSSAFLRLESAGKVLYALKRPDLPLSWLFPSHEKPRSLFVREMKENKKRKWMLIGPELQITTLGARCLLDSELMDEACKSADAETSWTSSQQLLLPSRRFHNTINRLSGTTGSREFAPYTQDVYYYGKGLTLVIFVLLDPAVTTIEAVKTGLTRMGLVGFGKDASIGLGRFSVVGSRHLPLPDHRDCTGMYCTAPCVPKHDSFHEAYFLPFVRFGKHGDAEARSHNPFKNPVIMADEGAVFIPKEREAFSRPYWGRAVMDVSLSMPNAVVQGYSPWLPIRVNMRGET
jgi:CRISPR-associated protein Csm4